MELPTHPFPIFWPADRPCRPHLTRGIEFGGKDSTQLKELQSKLKPRQIEIRVKMHANNMP